MGEVAELVFITPPGPKSHLISAVEMAKLLLRRHQRLSITLLIMQFPNATTPNNHTQKSITRLRTINLAAPQDLPPSQTLFFDFIESHIAQIKEIVSDLMVSSNLAGLVLDMFCTKFIQVAQELSIPAYVYFCSGACPYGLFQHLVSLKFEHNQELMELNNSSIDLSVPCFSIPLPAKVLPDFLVDENPALAECFLTTFKRISEAKGIIFNTFYEIESYAIDSLNSDGKTPKLYPVGPVFKDQSQGSFSFDDDVKKWLDDQPENSVVFLCFGTEGSFDGSQVREIALALENSGNRFLWSLRKQAMKGVRLATEFESYEQVLPEGFLERTKGVGKVVGWTAQVAVLSHPAVGGFVSHCGWNSILESVWYGVPIATFPLFAEQQLNAFRLVKELGVAEAIRVDYRRDFVGERQPEIVGSEEIEAAIRRLMAEEGGSGVRQQMKEMQNKARSALMEGGSSYNALNLFIEEVFSNNDVPE